MLNQQFSENAGDIGGQNPVLAGFCATCTDQSGVGFNFTAAPGTPKA